MTNEVYDVLRERLDHYSIGFPASSSGVDIAILERLFTPEEAELFLLMDLRLRTTEVIAERSGYNLKAVGKLLARMAEKGTVFRSRKGKDIRYAAIPFLIGIYEFQAGAMTRPMAELYYQYFEEVFIERLSAGEPLLRPIPVNEAVDAGNLCVATYDNAREIVMKQSLIAVTRCPCREEKRHIGHGCSKPLEVCLAFGDGAQYFIDYGRARQVSVDEAMSIVESAEKAGLVAQPTNSQNPEGLCNCCGDCCAALRALNRLNCPADVVSSTYYAVITEGACSGCELCLERCQMTAISMNYESMAYINPDRCIGCGLCITTCPSQAIRLDLKPDNRRQRPVATSRELLMNIAERRGYR